MVVACFVVKRGRKVTVLTVREENGEHLRKWRLWRKGVCAVMRWIGRFL